MSVKVGLVAAVVAPKTAVRPFANCVLPLPSPPVSASTPPRLIFSAKRRPKASVSSGLLEMNVATFQLRIANCELRNERTDSRERKLRELFAPVFLQTLAIPRRNGEE